MRCPFLSLVILPNIKKPADEQLVSKPLLPSLNSRIMKQHNNKNIIKSRSSPYLYYIPITCLVQTNHNNNNNNTHHRTTTFTDSSSSPTVSSSSSCTSSLGLLQKSSKCSTSSSRQDDAMMKSVDPHMDGLSPKKNVSTITTISPTTVANCETNEWSLATSDTNLSSRDGKSSNASNSSTEDSTSTPTSNIAIRIFKDVVKQDSKRKKGESSSPTTELMWNSKNGKTKGGIEEIRNSFFDFLRQVKISVTREYGLAMIQKMHFLDVFYDVKKQRVRIFETLKQLMKVCEIYLEMLVKPLMDEEGEEKRIQTSIHTDEEEVLSKNHDSMNDEQFSEKATTDCPFPFLLNFKKCIEKEYKNLIPILSTHESLVQWLRDMCDLAIEMRQEKLLKKQKDQSAQSDLSTSDSSPPSLSTEPSESSAPLSTFSTDSSNSMSRIPPSSLHSSIIHLSKKISQVKIIIMTSSLKIHNCYKKFQDKSDSNVLSLCLKKNWKIIFPISKNNMKNM